MHVWVTDWREEFNCGGVERVGRGDYDGEFPETGYHDDISTATKRWFNAPLGSRRHVWRDGDRPS